MLSEHTRISEDGTLVIPETIRQAMGLKGGESLTLSLDEHGLHVQTMRQSIARTQAMVRQFVDPSRSLSDELIAERREEFRREEERWSKP